MDKTNTADRKWTIVDMPFPERLLAKEAAKRANVNQAEWLARAIRREVLAEREAADGAPLLGDVMSPGVSGMTLVDPLHLSLAEKREALALAEHVAAQRGMRLADRVYQELGRDAVARLGISFASGARPFQRLRVEQIAKQTSAAGQTGGDRLGLAQGQQAADI